LIEHQLTYILQIHVFCFLFFYHFETFSIRFESMITFAALTLLALVQLAAPRARSQSASEGLNGLGLLKFAPPESKVGGQLIGRSTPTRFLDQAAPSNWQDPQFDDSSWRAVTLPCGYDRGSAALTALLATNVPQMLGQGRDVFHRHRFVPSNAQFALIGVYGARLRIAADNAASAWLNNQQVIVGQSDSNYRYWSYDVPLAASLFRSRPGDANVFAFQVLNTVNSSDQFFDFELVVDTSLVSVIEPAVGPGTNTASGWFADDNVQANDNSWFTSPTFQFTRSVRRQFADWFQRSRRGRVELQSRARSCHRRLSLAK
jgi:hypothetical protein